MAFGIGGGLILNNAEYSWNSFCKYESNRQISFPPYLCITIACGAISGFHTTQSPMMARCLKTEKRR